jgi:CRISPR-associated protein Csd1
MLNLLIDYAKTHHLTVEPGFKPKTVRWAIVCSATGHFLNIQELGNPEEKSNRGQTFYVCPDLSQPEMKAGGPGCRHFLVDNVEVVALMGKNGDLRLDSSLDKDDRKKAIAKHEFFKSLIKQSATAMKVASALSSLLESEKSLSELQHAFADQRFKPTDSVTFAITGRTPMFLVDDNLWHNWWRGFRQSLLKEKKSGGKKGTTKKSSTVESMRCFGSGSLVEPALTHPKIEGLSGVGGLAMGDVLAGFKQESFQSYFLTQSKNAAVSEEMATAYRAGLNDLIKQHSQTLAGAKVVHWYSGPTEVKKQEDVMGLLDNSLDLAWLDEAGNEKDNERDALHRANIFLDALRSGTKPRLRELEKYRYYAMILSANSGRVVTRDWMEGQFGELAESILAWFKDLEISGIHGERSANSPSIERVITCLLPTMKPGQKYSNWIKPIGGERSQLWHAAISREMSLPYKVLSRLMPLHQAFMLSGDFDEALDERSKNRATNLSILYTRMGLLKAYHIRKGDKTMEPYLNEAHPHPAYHCGRLMAVLAEIQQAALGNVSANVIQRYYAAASTTPALVLGRLVRTSNFHLEKIEYRKRRSGLKDVFTGIWGRLKDDVPRVLDLEAQSLFALGFYQQFGKLASIDWAKYENQFTSTYEGGE